MQRWALRPLPRVFFCFVSALPVAPAAQQGTCPHCTTEPAFQEFIREPEPLGKGEFTSDVHVLWPTQVEVVPVTQEAGGWQPASFSQALAREVIRMWREFQSSVLPSLPEGSAVRAKFDPSDPGSANKAFYAWQKALFLSGGDLRKAAEQQEPTASRQPGMSTTWPELNELPEYKKLLKTVDVLSRRYLVRAGVLPEAAAALNTSIFSWAAVYRPGEFNAPHVHLGQHHHGVFYAQSGPAGGKIRFSDPRGKNPPFGHDFVHTPKSGELLFFPAWLSHMATVSSPAGPEQASSDEHLRVAFSFNIGPPTGPLPSHEWWTDPLADLRFRWASKIRPRELFADVPRKGGKR